MIDRIPLPARAAILPDTIAPDGSAIRYLVGAEQAATRSSVVEVELSAGQASRPVRHQTVEEIWYILAGRGEVWRCPPGTLPETVAPQTVSPGDALAIPTGWAFQFRSLGPGSLRFLCHTSPPWPGDAEASSVEASAWEPGVYIRSGGRDS